MGNICGCVRGPKEECYVDPKKAPLKPGSRELKGRRYFQRKKRKSWDLQRLEPPTLTGIVAGGDSEGPGRTAEESRGGQGEPSEVTAPSAGWRIHSEGDNVGEAPVLDPREEPPAEGSAFRPGKLHAERDGGGSLEEKLHGTHAASGAARDGLLARKLLRRQLRRAVSFGAVEHTLRTLRGDGASGGEDAFAKIIWGSQARSSRRRRRRRASVCSGYLEHPAAPAKCDSTPRKVKKTKKKKDGAIFIDVQGVMQHGQAGGIHSGFVSSQLGFKCHTKKMQTCSCKGEINVKQISLSYLNIMSHGCRVCVSVRHRVVK